VVSNVVQMQPARGPGRPRSDAAHQAILEAVIPTIQALGYDAFSIEAVAARAGVGKATIYRRWASKEDLVAEGAARFVSRIPTPDLGALEADLTAVLRSDAAMHSDLASPLLLASLFVAMQRSPRIAVAVREGFIASRQAALRTVLARAVRRGEVAPDVDLDLVVQLCAGPLLYRSVVSGQPSDAATVLRLVDLILHGLQGERR
jgi:AcrR family transcriptional regulator